MGITRTNRYRLKHKQQFIPGLILNEGFFVDIIKPIIDAHFPNLLYDAALTGHCSDALGYDTYISMDHYWGPRASLFLSQEDHSKVSERLLETLKRDLPQSYKGFPTNWNFDLPDHGACPEFASDGQINPNIEITTVGRFVKEELGIEFPGSITSKDWLAFPEQELLHLTSGKVFNNGLSELMEMRGYFQYYPHDVWLFKMRSLWNSIAEEQAFIGRCHDVNDRLGERVIAARITNKLMKICFYLEKTYYPYSKWFGTGFAKLACSRELTPLFDKILTAKSYKSRESALCDAYLKIAGMHNALNITTPISLEITDYYQRGYRGFQTIGIVESLTKVIDPHLWNELGISDFGNSNDRILEIETMLDDSNYTRNPGVLRRIIFS